MYIDVVTPNPGNPCPASSPFPLSVILPTLAPVSSVSVLHRTSPNQACELGLVYSLVRSWAVSLSSGRDPSCIIHDELRRRQTFFDHGSQTSHTTQKHHARLARRPVNGKGSRETGQTLYRVHTYHHTHPRSPFRKGSLCSAFAFSHNSNSTPSK